MLTKASRATTALLCLAGVTGAGGVIAAAAAAHAAKSAALASAAQIMMLHAAAAVAVLAAGLHHPHPARWRWVAAVMLVGALLFGGDISMHTATGRHLFPMAAPTGGTTLILSWLALAAVAIWDRGGA